VVAFKLCAHLGPFKSMFVISKVTYFKPNGALKNGYEGQRPMTKQIDYLLSQNVGKNGVA